MNNFILIYILLHELLIQQYCLMKCFSESISLKTNFISLITSELIQLYVATNPYLLGVDHFCHNNLTIINYYCHGDILQLKSL
jgi:hypothetical protein